MSPTASSRRTLLKQLGLAGVGLSILDVPGWVLPALAQSETLVPFTDIPDNVRWEIPPDRRTLDIRTIDGPFTPKEEHANALELAVKEFNGSIFAKLRPKLILAFFIGCALSSSAAPGTPKRGDAEPQEDCAKERANDGPRRSHVSNNIALVLTPGCVSATGSEHQEEKRRDLKK